MPWIFDGLDQADRPIGDLCNNAIIEFERLYVKLRKFFEKCERHDSLRKSAWVLLEGKVTNVVAEIKMTKEF